MQTAAEASAIPLFLRFDRELAEGDAYAPTLAGADELELHVAVRQDLRGATRK